MRSKQSKGQQYNNLIKEYIDDPDKPAPLTGDRSRRKAVQSSPPLAVTDTPHRRVS